MILSLHIEIGGRSSLIIFLDELVKMVLFCSHVIRNDSTQPDCTNSHKIRYKLQNTLIPHEMFFRRISSVTKDTNSFSLQKVYCSEMEKYLSTTDALFCSKLCILYSYIDLSIAPIG